MRYLHHGEEPQLGRRASRLLVVAAIAGAVGTTALVLMLVLD